MEALERARSLNALLALPRLERMLRVYRTWVNVEGVEGGMALSRRELQCVLEFPTLDHHVSFLFDTFQCKKSPSTRNNEVPRVDLVTLLTTAAILAQGALADKARFVFSLVDLDTEDDIVEAELALVISTCCDGLLRLELMHQEEEMTEMDAMALAYDAFDFVELEDGDKMTFAMFLKWCVFHPGPSSLLGRIGCLFSVCDAVRKMKEALQERNERLSVDSLAHYNDIHFGSLDEEAENVSVLVGPIVGKVSATKANVLMEVDALTTIKCFAFALPQGLPEGGADAVNECFVCTQECALEPFRPTVLTITDLSPGTTYVLRFLGVRKSDREKCVAVITSRYVESVSNNLPAFSKWQIRLLNHQHQQVLHLKTPRAYETRIYQKVALDGYRNQKPLLTIHYGGIVLSPQKVSAMLRLLEQSNQNPPDQTTEERVLEMMRQAYRCALSEPNLWTLLRSHSNWFFGDNDSVLFGGSFEWGVTKRATFTAPEENLLRLAFPVWQAYIERLWGSNGTQSQCLKLDNGVICAPIMMKNDLHGEGGETEFTARVSAILNEFSSAPAIFLMTVNPLFNPSEPTEYSKEVKLVGLDSGHQWRLIQEIVDWNLADLRRQIALLSFNGAESCQTLLSIKNTTLSITQLMCGPLSGISMPLTAKVEECARPVSNSTDQVTIRHGVLDRRPQYVQISSISNLQEFESSALAGRRRSSAVTDTPYVLFQAQPIRLEKQREVCQILGPIVGYVSSHAARVLIECDADGEVACLAIDRLTLENITVVQLVKAHRPAIFTLTSLTPGRTYDLTYRGLLKKETGVLQTLREDLPAFRLLLVSEDRYLDGTIDNVDGGTQAKTLPSYIENVSSNFLPSVGTFQADATVHIGCVVALAHDLHRKYINFTQEAQPDDLAQQRNMVRQCARQHWNTRWAQQLFARGAHWFSGVGVIRELLTKEDVPVSFLRMVQQTLAEYEQVGDSRSHSFMPYEKYLYRLQNSVALLLIDTFEEILNTAEYTQFVQPTETILSATQWKALEYWLRPTQVQTEPNIIIIICDVPLISQQGERADMKVMWNQCASREHNSMGYSYAAEVRSTSWNLYPKEQARLIHLIFSKLLKHPELQIVFVCKGAYSSRTTIIDNVTQLSFDQVVVGPVSRSMPLVWSEKSASSQPTIDDGLAKLFTIQHEIPVGATKSQQYCALELVPHPLGASSDVKFYIQNSSEARLILGPIVGRITPRTVRILVELDRGVSNLVCHLTDSATARSYSIQTKVDALMPTIIKVEGLQPGTRYSIHFEGLMESKDTVFGHVLTPPWVSLASEWLLVNRNSITDFLPIENRDSARASQWSRILAKGMSSFTAQLAGETSHRNGDFLGNHDDEEQQYFNPWHSIEDEYLSEPLSSPQLLLHLGGQVDMSRAFTDKELATLVVRIARYVESNQANEDNEDFQQLRVELRHRMQEVYRIAWGVPPMKRLLRYCSNLMLLNEESDLYFSRRNLLCVLGANIRNEISDSVLEGVTTLLKGLAFELWQLYQNQLWVDLAERELKYGTRSSDNKTAFSTTYGIYRMVVANVSHEVHQYCAAVEAEKNESKTDEQTSVEVSNLPTISLFSAPSWKIVDEALENVGAESESGRSRAAPTRPKNPVQQLVLVVSGDLMEWSGSKLFPALRPEIVKLFEKLFAWKFIDRAHREVSVICSRTNGSSISFEVMDEKLSEKFTLTCIGSISEIRELLHRDQKKVKGATPVIAKSAAISKGHFSKRFSYRSITSTSSAPVSTTVTSSSVLVNEKQSSTSVELGRTITRCRSFASYRFITDYRRGFLDETLRFYPPRVAMPKVVLGPVIGRMVLGEAVDTGGREPLADGDPDDPIKKYFSVPILLEVNADARVVCVVTDILANKDVRVAHDLKRNDPYVFQISSLAPERRYVYRFEGIANSQHRRGSFHTPPSSCTILNALAVSSNFPEHMDESRDSLWSVIRKRVQVSWNGFDMILHMGGQVSMHEAAFECFEWVRRELNCRRKSANDDKTSNFLVMLRRKVRQRLQQRYHLCWNIPNVRETLAHTSNWFLRSQADVAPFFCNHKVLSTEAARIVLAEAKKIVDDYQISLMQQDDDVVDDDFAELQQPDVDVTRILLPDHPEINRSEQPEDNDKAAEGDKVLESRSDEQLEEPEEGNQSHDETVSSAGVVHDVGESGDTAQFVHIGEVGVFVCDMRSTPQNDVVTCNNRLLRPLTQQERALIGEQQWMKLEKALKKKAVMVFILCLELPLILTDAKYVDAMREEAALSSVVDPDQKEATGRWKLYDRLTISQHWVSCRRQLEQLLNLLFRWKAKHRGRDVIVLSGGMRVGLETLLQDHETKLSVRNLTVGPLTARVEPDFDNMPLDGTACPTFMGSGSQRDERFTFTHSIVSNKNYLLIHAAITHEQANKLADRGETSVETKSATIETEFVIDDERVESVHPVNLYRRFPSWWVHYIPMGKIVFWDDTVMMRAQSDEDMTALAQYLQDGREFTAALEVLFEKHQFAEAARMEELRSKDRRRQRGPEELRVSLRAVFAELWKVLPESHQQRVAYFRDEFVFDFLLGNLAPELFEDATAQDEDVERPPLEFAAFSTLCRNFIFDASVLHLSLRMQQEDEIRTIALQRAESQRLAAEREAQRLQQEQQRSEEEAELERLRVENPEEYAKRKLAEQEIVLQEKQAKADAAREKRKAEKLRDVEEELAIAKEQRKLDKLAESGNDPLEFNRRREQIADRIRKFDERKRHRETEEARRREKKEKKKTEKASQQKNA